MVSLHTKKWAYYNDSDPFVCAWARELIKAGLVAPGEVDERPIKEVQASDLDGFVQCHFFCGILGWSYALRLAGWPDDRSVWTGSCPCQPFSGLGPKTQFTDRRDLWPAWMGLIRQCGPQHLFGEQVNSRSGYEWLARVHTDLEGAGYAVAAAVLPASLVAAPHRRYRIYFAGVGNAQSHGRHKGFRVVAGAPLPRPAPRQSPWASLGVFGHDGTQRRIESGCFTMAHGLPRRMGRLRGYGNAIVPQVAQVFIEAYCDARGLK